jgi:hypothetical protein
MRALALDNRMFFFVSLSMDENRVMEFTVTA